MLAVVTTRAWRFTPLTLLDTRQQEKKIKDRDQTSKKYIHYKRTLRSLQNKVLPSKS